MADRETDKYQIPLTNVGVDYLALIEPGNVPFGSIYEVNLPQHVADKVIQKPSSGSKSPMPKTPSPSSLSLNYAVKIFKS